MHATDFRANRTNEQGRLSPQCGFVISRYSTLERDGLIDGEWKPTENNRRAKYYTLTAKGRKSSTTKRLEWAGRCAIGQNSGASVIPCSEILQAGSLLSEEQADQELNEEHGAMWRWPPKKDEAGEPQGSLRAVRLEREASSKQGNRSLCGWNLRRNLLQDLHFASACAQIAGIHRGCYFDARPRIGANGHFQHCECPCVRPLPVDTRTKSHHCIAAPRFGSSNVFSYPDLKYSTRPPPCFRDMTGMQPSTWTVQHDTTRASRSG